MFRTVFHSICWNELPARGGGIIIGQSLQTSEFGAAAGDEMDGVRGQTAVEQLLRVQEKHSIADLL